MWSSKKKLVNLSKSLLKNKSVLRFKECSPTSRLELAERKKQRKRRKKTLMRERSSQKSDFGD